MYNIKIIMDADLIKKQFNEYVNNFMEELKKSSDNNRKLIEELYKSDKDYIEEIHNSLFEYKRDFLDDTKKLDKLFDSNEIELIKGLSLSKIWKQSDDDNKGAISQYVKVLIFILEAQDKTNEKDKKNEEEVAFEDLLKKSLLDNDNNLKSFCKNMNNPDNSIVNMAKNIADELKQEDSINDNNISSLLNGNGQGMGQLINKITSKIDSEIKSGNIDQSKLLSDAQQMMGQNNGLFQNLFNNFNKMGQQTQSKEKKNEQSSTLKAKNIKKNKKKK